MLKQLTITFVTLLCLTSIFSFSLRKPSADLLIYNGIIYTVDGSFTKAEAMIVNEGKILKVGSTQELKSLYKFEKEIDLKGKYIYPGFIDAHSHLLSLGANQFIVDLSQTKSWKDVIETCQKFLTNNPSTKILIGRGWDQNKWSNKNFPDNTLLNTYFTDMPVLLKRVDGHAAIVNQFVLDACGITPQTTVEGGDILKKNGMLTGVLIDNAIDMVTNNKDVFPDKDHEQLKLELDTAQKICFSLGLTSVCDAGINVNMANFYKNSTHQIRVYAMMDATDDNIANHQAWYHHSPTLNISSFKLYADGALGSRGACLLKEYADHKSHHGFMLTPIHKIGEIVEQVSKTNFQLNTHCIGDSANRVVLNAYGTYLDPHNDKRWRIEHAQVINNDDVELFRMYKIIPSVQPTHATSDLTWAHNRLANRVYNAYSYKTLLEKTEILALGTDFPVENPNPLHTFYSAVTFNTPNGKPAGGAYTPNQTISRQDALKGMTIWAAYAAFEENEKGSLEPGKYADFTILDVDLLKDDVIKIRNAKVIATYVNGALVYQK